MMLVNWFLELACILTLQMPLKNCTENMRSQRVLELEQEIQRKDLTTN